MRASKLVAVVLVGLATSPARAATGRITGFVNDAGGRALSGICVQAETTDGERITSTSATPDGSYSIDVSPGDHVVTFIDCVGIGYAAQWWNGRSARAQAGTVSVQAGETIQGIDAQLMIGGVISGTVTDASHAGLAQICIAADADGAHVQTTTGTTGTFAMPVPPGSYRVLFSDCGRNEYAQQWFDAKLSSGDATPVEVEAGAYLTGIDAVMGTDVPDPAITQINVEGSDLPGGIPPSFLDPVLHVSVFFTNDSSTPVDATLLVEVCPATIGPCEPLIRDDLPLQAHADGSKTVSWDTTSWVGDARITARIVSPIDRDPTNNDELHVQCVRIRCTGYGVHAKA